MLIFLRGLSTLGPMTVLYSCSAMAELAAALGVVGSVEGMVMFLDERD